VDDELEKIIDLKISNVKEPMEKLEVRTDKEFDIIYKKFREQERKMEAQAAEFNNKLDNFTKEIKGVMYKIIGFLVSSCVGLVIWIFLNK
jgi:hypothetical protein